MILHEATIASDLLRPTYVLVDLDAISYNVAQIEAKANGALVLYILKANAYGHGVIRIARHLQSLGAKYFGVAYLEEGVLLREHGIKVPILIMGGIVGEQIPTFIEYNLTITASSVDKLRQIDQTARKLGKRAIAHLKIDTGMERIGMHYYSADSLLRASLEVTSTHIEGIYTHYAQADIPDDDYTLLQQKRFDQVLSFYKHQNLPRPLIHASNSGGLLKSSVQQYDMVRSGILLYGVYPHASYKNLITVKPALTWKTRVVFFKVVKPGHPVSYGGHYSTDHNTRIVTLPVGYGDGYMRSMSGKASVLIRGYKYPQVGSICMDQMMIDIGSGTAYNDDEVILVGRQDEQEITVEDLATWAGTIPYEILTNINTRVPRVYFHSTKETES